MEFTKTNFSTDTKGEGGGQEGRGDGQEGGEGERKGWGIWRIMTHLVLPSWGPFLLLAPYPVSLCAPSSCLSLPTGWHPRTHWGYSQWRSPQDWGLTQGLAACRHTRGEGKRYAFETKGGGERTSTVIETEWEGLKLRGEVQEMYFGLRKRGGGGVEQKKYTVRMIQLQLLIT